MGGAGYGHYVSAQQFETYRFIKGFGKITIGGAFVRLPSSTCRNLAARPWIIIQYVI
jgi:hypothetical protein